LDDLLDRALNAAQLAGASYADVRVVEARSQIIEVKNRKVATLQEPSSAGVGIRVLIDGAWGFAASADLELEEVERCARLACRVARASARVRREPIRLSRLEPYRARWETPLARDP